MPAARFPSYRSRELRRRVVLPARVRTSAGWSDACILNVSSRGLLIHSRGAAETGKTIELHHRPHAIVARVIWRNGARAGLRSEGRVPVEEIMILGQAHNVTLTAVEQPGVERGPVPRHQESRARGGTIEFVGALVIAAVLATGMLAMVETALARPRASIGAVLER
jgi:hypothetical protein